MRALLDAETPVVCLVAKSDVRHVREALRTTLEENLAMVADTVAFFVGARPPGVPRLRALLRRLRARPRLRRPGARDGVRRRAPRSASCATPTAACCRWASAGSSPTSGRARAASSASTARTTPAARSPTRWPPSRPASPTCRGRRTATASGPGNADTFSLIGNLVTKMGLPVVPAGVPARAAAGQPRHRRAGQHRPRRPPALRRRLGVRAQGRACTPARSRSARSSTTTSTRPSSATTCASWSPRWPAGPRSSSRAASSASTSPGRATPSAASSTR